MCLAPEDGNIDNSENSSCRWKGSRPPTPVRLLMARGWPHPPAMFEFTQQLVFRRNGLAARFGTLAVAGCTPQYIPRSYARASFSGAIGVFGPGIVRA